MYVRIKSQPTISQVYNKLKNWQHPEKNNKNDNHFFYCYFIISDAMIKIMSISFQSFFTGWIYKEKTFERNRRELFSFPNFFFCFSSATCASFQNPNFLYHRQVPC